MFVRPFVRPSIRAHVRTYVRPQPFLQAISSAIYKGSWQLTTDS